MEYITTANVLVWIFITLGLWMMFISYWLAACGLFPKLVSRCDEALAKPLLHCLLGLLVTVVPLVVGIAALKALPAALKWIGLLIIAFPIVAGLFGSAGLAQRIGRGLPTPADERQPWRAVLRGGIVLSLTFLLPVLGQLLIIPLTIATGAGLCVVCLLRRTASPAPPPLLPPSHS
jgi:hypothetical protein